MDIMLKRILELMGNKHGSAKDLANHLGVSPNRITDWKAGRVKSFPKYATQIADYYNVSLDWLSGKTDIKNAAPKRNDAIPSNLIPYKPTGRIPIYGKIPAGNPMLATDEIEGYYSIDLPSSEPHFALWVTGRSMINAGIEPGDLIIIRVQNCADNGQIVACRVNGDEATLKRFKQVGDTVILMPENPEYEPIIVPCSEFENGYASIIGVAVNIMKSLL